MSPARVCLCAGGRVDASAQEPGAVDETSVRCCVFAAAYTSYTPTSLPRKCMHLRSHQGFFIDRRSFQRQRCCDGNGTEEGATCAAGQNSHLFISLLLYILYSIIICGFGLRDVVLTFQEYICCVWSLLMIRSRKGSTLENHIREYCYKAINIQKRA